LNGRHILVWSPASEQKANQFGPNNYEKGGKYAETRVDLVTSQTLYLASFLGNIPGVDYSDEIRQNY